MNDALLITGCAHGIGRAAAVMAAARGVKLALLDLDGAALGALADELRAAHPGLAIVTAIVDVTQAEALAAAMRGAAETLGGFRAVIANAGGVSSLVVAGMLPGAFSPFTDSRPAEWRRIIDLNLFGVLNTAHAAVPMLLEAGSGRLVLVASVAGLVGAPGLGVYAASKGAVIAFGKSLAKELAPRGISVNTVAPGGVATRAFPPGSPGAAKRAERIPMGRLAAPEEVANTLLYFALDAPDYVTGEVLSVSGGPPA
ncbi:SDR family NAD(P)-dependent oxidoreductase [Falsiroseomonas stagni]|nr:SDR family oxidoreductase [Falsiroseomonas stagni]